MLKIVKKLMTLGDVAPGYKTYFVAALATLHALVGILTEVAPLFDGNMGLVSVAMILLQSPYVAELLAALGGAFFKAGTERNAEEVAQTRADGQRFKALMEAAKSGSFVTRAE